MSIQFVSKKMRQPPQNDQAHLWDFFKKRAKLLFFFDISK